MNNQAFYNAAFAGVVGGSRAGRQYQANKTSPAAYTHFIVSCVAFAVAMDNAIDPIPGGPNAAQADMLGAIVAAFWEERMPSASTPLDPGYVADAALIKAVYDKAAEAIVTTGAVTLHAKAVCLLDVANLASYAVMASATFNDNVTMVEGDVVLLVGQATPAQNGPYAVGVVTAGHAPLTRIGWRAGDTLPVGSQIQLGGSGLVYANTTWQAMRTGTTFVVATNDPELYPLSVTGTALLTSGAVDLAVPIRSALSGLALTRQTPVGTANTIAYVSNGALVPGGGASGTAHLMAAIAGGTVNAADGSTLLWTLTNQAKA